MRRQVAYKQTIEAHSLRTKSVAFARGLLALGVQRGDRVGIWSDNHYEWILTQAAAALGGFILVCSKKRFFADSQHPNLRPQANFRFFRST